MQVGTVRSLVATCGAKELLEQLGTRTVCLDIQSLQRSQVVRLGRLGLHLMQSWELHLGRGEQSAPVLEVVAVLHSHLLFLETVQKMRQGVEAQLLYLLLQLPIGELWFPSSGSKVVAWWHSVVVEVIADHRVLVGRLLDVANVFPSLPLGEVPIAEAVVVQMRLLEVLLRVLL